MEFHEAANIFPLDEENIDALAEDIRVNGQVQPIEIFEGKILDGRRRWTACQRLGIQPKMKAVYPDDPIAHVLSLNLHRRHLNPSQLSMVAARARDYYDRQAKERQKMSQGRGVKGVENLPPLNETGKARDQAGKAVGVSGKSVDYATRVLEKGTPALIQAVDEGKMAISTAAILAAEPPEVQDKEASLPKRNRRYGSGLGGSIANGHHSTSESKPDPDPDNNPEDRKSRGKGITMAHEAINLLAQIPKNDGLRKRGFQIVLEWVQRNLKGMR